VLGNVLGTLAGMNIEKAQLQLGVDKASSMVKDAVKKSDNKTVMTTSGGSSIGISSIFLIAIPAGIGYVMYDPKAKEAFLKYSTQALEKGRVTVSNVQTIAQDKKYRDQVAKQLQEKLKYAKAQSVVYYKRVEEITYIQYKTAKTYFEQQLAPKGKPM